MARRTNRNFCAIISDETGRKLFFKHNLGGSFKYIVTDAERRRRDIANILAFRILNETFAFHSMVLPILYLLFLMVVAKGGCMQLPRASRAAPKRFKGTNFE